MFGRYLESYFEKKQVKMDDTKTVQTDLDSSRQELFARGLGFIVALLVFRKLISSRVSTGTGGPSNPAVLKKIRKF